MKVVSVCVKCEHQTEHEADNNGHAVVTCASCSTVYEAQTYEVRATGGRRDRRSGVKDYRVRVKEPDRDETLLEFPSTQDIEMRSGDWITGSFQQGKLKFLINHKINRYWNVQPKMGCLVLALTVASIPLWLSLAIVMIIFAW